MVGTIELSTEHLNDVLGNHEVDGGDGLQKMCQAVNRTRILRSSLLQRVGLFDRRLIDGIAGMATKAEASTDDDELGAIVRSDHCDVVVKNSLDNHGTINDKILIALADHISLALERERKGVSCENPLLLEIQQFYRKEYALAGRALQIIKEYMGIQMSEEEQGFITLHIVNATMPQRSDRLIVSVQLVRDVLAIVSERYATTLDDTSLPYERFVRHLQFFAQRALDPTAGQINGDALFRIDETAYPCAFSCADAIAAHLSSTYNVVVTNAEKSYLAYHIVNLLGEPGL